MKYTLELTEEHLKILDAALQELPYKFSAPVIQHINSQLEAQEKRKNDL